MKNLVDLCLGHSGKGLDKWMCYLPEYERLLSGCRGERVALLEIGVQNGGSLEVFGRYFAQARVIVGCDIEPKCGGLVFDDPRIHIVVGDAGSDAAESAVAAISDRYDIIIDDGSHRSSDIVKSFVRYFKRLNEGGVYIAEDLHCSYWHEFEGGLHYPYSSMAFFKRLADVVNHEHWGITALGSDALRGFGARYGVPFDEPQLAAVHSVEFLNSLCVIRKCPPEQNRRGRRVLAGSICDVEPCSWTADAQVSSAEAFPQENHFWSAMRTPPEEAYEGLVAQLAERVHRIEMLEQSMSWRVTEPLRLIYSGLRHLLSRLSLVKRSFGGDRQ